MGEVDGWEIRLVCVQVEQDKQGKFVKGTTYVAQRSSDRSTVKYSQAWLEQRCSQPARTSHSTNVIVCMQV